MLSSLFPGRRITSATPPRAALQGGPSAFLQDAAYITGTSLFAALSVVPPVVSLMVLSVGETTAVVRSAAGGRVERPYPAGGWSFRSVGAVGAIVVSPTDRHGAGADAAAW